MGKKIILALVLCFSSCQPNEAKEGHQQKVNDVWQIGDENKSRFFFFVKQHFSRERVRKSWCCNKASVKSIKVAVKIGGKQAYQKETASQRQVKSEESGVYDTLILLEAVMAGKTSGWQLVVWWWGKENGNIL